MDEFTAAWLKDLTFGIQALIKCEMCRLSEISTVKTEEEAMAVFNLGIAHTALSKYKVEEVKDGESIEDRS